MTAIFQNNRVGIICGSEGKHINQTLAWVKSSRRVQLDDLDSGYEIGST